MSGTAPADPLAPITGEELRAVLARQLDRIANGSGVVSCTGLDSETESALYAFLMHRSTTALAAAYAANERRIAGWL